MLLALCWLQGFGSAAQRVKTLWLPVVGCSLRWDTNNDGAGVQTLPQALNTASRRVDRVRGLAGR